jgi:hypothetical protein
VLGEGYKILRLSILVFTPIRLRVSLSKESAFPRYAALRSKRLSGLEMFSGNKVNDTTDMFAASSIVSISLNVNVHCIMSPSSFRIKTAYLRMYPRAPHNKAAARTR